MSAPAAIAVTQVLDRLARNDRGRLLAVLMGGGLSIGMAEDSLQEAMAAAVVHWSRSGLPASPYAWLLTVARRKTLDRLRRQSVERRWAREVEALSQTDEDTDEAIPDQRLRLIFTCCHPAIEQKSQIALTLRLLGGLSTRDIARAFLDADTTIGQRILRAKTKIAEAGIPFAIPEPAEWTERLNAVLCVIYLIYNQGYTAGPSDGDGLACEGVFLMRMLHHLRPDDAEIAGALALMLFTHARRSARIGVDGATIPLAQQDRALWRYDEIAEAHHLLDAAIALHTPGPYQIKAAIAACHIAPEGPDWPQISLLYARLLDFEPTPVIRLNLAVAWAEDGRLVEALALLDSMEAELVDYQPFHATRADFCLRAGDAERAAEAFSRAIDLAASEADAAYLRSRLTLIRPVSS